MDSNNLPDQEVLTNKVSRINLSSSYGKTNFKNSNFHNNRDFNHNQCTIQLIHINNSKIFGMLLIKIKITTPITKISHLHLKHHMTLVIKWIKWDKIKCFNNNNNNKSNNNINNKTNSNNNSQLTVKNFPINNTNNGMKAKIKHNPKILKIINLWIKPNYKPKPKPKKLLYLITPLKPFQMNRPSKKKRCKANNKVKISKKEWTNNNNNNNIKCHSDMEASFSHLNNNKIWI